MNPDDLHGRPVNTRRISYTKDDPDTAIFDNEQLREMNSIIYRDHMTNAVAASWIQHTLSETGALIPITVYNEKFEKVDGITSTDDTATMAGMESIHAGWAVSFGPLISYHEDADTMPLFSSWETLGQAIREGSYPSTGAMVVKTKDLIEIIPDDNYIVIDPWFNSGHEDILYSKSMLTMTPPPDNTNEE